LDWEIVAGVEQRSRLRLAAVQRVLFLRVLRLSLLRLIALRALDVAFVTCLSRLTHGAGSVDSLRNFDPTDFRFRRFPIPPVAPVTPIAFGWSR
jgi:hypothetical protein